MTHRLTCQKPGVCSLSEPMHRRSFLNGIATMTLGIAGQALSQASETEPSPDTGFLDYQCQCHGDAPFESSVGAEGSTKPKRPFLPSQFLDHEMSYARFIYSLDLRYIFPLEVIRPHRTRRGGVRNGLPPQSLWENMAETLRVADEIRYRLGSPMLRINSAYRSPAYNAVCRGSATRSYHIQNCALDLVYRAGPWAAAKVARDLRSEGLFRGGIGVYRTFLHVDTRGHNVNWRG